MRLGSLGRRLLLAFMLVALASVLIVTTAALIGSERGIAATSEAGREQAAVDVAALAAQAYADVGGWDGADLGPAQARAQEAGARLQVRDAGQSGGWGAGMGRGALEEPVVVAGEQVGSVRLVFGRPAEDTGRGIAWSWIIGAALAAMAIAALASWLVLRQITRPVGELIAASRQFAAGDLGARAGITAPGELGDLARTFDATADAVAAAEDRRRSIAADVAHELRTPLAALLAGLEEARDGLVPADEATLTGLHDQATRLGRIVNDLAALSEAEAPAPAARLERCDLAQVAVRSAQQHAAQLRAAGISIDVRAGQPVVVLADAGRMDQVLGNLLANVARYCRPGDGVTVRVRAQDGAGLLEVADTGPGIAPDDLPRVFDRFWRGPGAAPVTGSGIGLAVVQALVVGQGGTVAAESDGRSGTTMRVTLPLAP